MGCCSVQGMEDFGKESERLECKAIVPYQKPFIEQLREHHDRQFAKICNVLMEEEDQLRQETILKGEFDYDSFIKEERLLYHGSGNREIKEFEPRSENVRDPKEGAVVFATPSIRLASCYLFKWDDSWVRQSIYNSEDSSEIYMVISDRKRFQALDLGGTIYFLPSRTFGFDENKGLGVYEWTSKEKIVPVDQINFSSALAAMGKFDIRVHFLDESEFNACKSLSPEDQKSFLDAFKED